MKNRNPNAPERRSFPGVVRAEQRDGAWHVVGTAVVFGQRSLDMGGWVEVIAPSVATCLNSSPDVRCLRDHDPSLILGRTVSGTLTLRADETGIHYDAVAPETQYARDLATVMERGDVTQSSFSFVCVDDTWNYDEVSGYYVRTVQQIELYDVSPVTFPAYTQTTSGMRSAPSTMPGEVRSRLGFGGARRDDGFDATGDNLGFLQALSECSCDCAQCAAGSCGICSNDDCIDPNCACQAFRSAARNALLLLRAEEAAL